MRAGIKFLYILICILQIEDRKKKKLRRENIQTLSYCNSTEVQIRHLIFVRKAGLIKQCSINLRR